jgi:signal transduction histidine kinase
LAGFRDELLIAGPIALLLACLAGYALAGLSLRQVESMRRRAAAISADNPGERLPVPLTGDEVEQLGRTLNEMLDRLESALQRERDFLADASHELRTPLTLLRTELELALREGGPAERLLEAVRASAHEVDRLTQLTEDLLLIARSDRGKLPVRLETLDAAEVAESVVRRYRWRANDQGVELVSSVPTGTEVRGDRLRLEQALGNLVDNALRHGAGPVRLESVAADGGVELHVCDAGHGFPPPFLPRAFERFSGSRRHGDDGGAGLGLSIVRAIADAHGGTARASNCATGGADVALILPRR